MTVKKESATTQGLVVLTIVFGLIIIGLLLSLTKASSATSQTAETEITGDTQYIDLTARGGYFPNTITAKANINTILRVKTSNTFDCSSALVIPSLNYRANLPASDTTEIKIPPQTANAEIRGTCSMGMYRFTIKFI